MGEGRDSGPGLHAVEMAKLQARISELESTLRERERAYATLVHNLPGFVYRCRNDRDWAMEFLSEGCFRVTGYPSEDFIERRLVTYNDLVLPEYREPLWRIWQDALSRREPFEEEYPIRAAGGEIRWVWERGQGVFGPGGELLCLEGYIKDITDLRRAKSAQMESEALVRSIGNNLPGGMLYQIIRDRHGNRRLSYLSEGVRALYGCPPEEGLADPAKIYGRVAEEDRERLFEEEERAYRAMVPFCATVRMLDPCGGVRWSVFASSPRLLEDGTTCWDGVELDITEWKLAEERLRKSEALLRSVSANLPDAFLTQASRTSESGGWKLDYVSEGIQNLFGLTPEEVLTDPARFYDRIAPEDRQSFWERAEEAYKTLSPFSVQVRTDTARRGVRWLHFTSKPRVSEDGATCWDGIALDITERKLAEEALQVALDERETLLKELYHRTKNNMQVIVALLDRQASASPDAPTREALGEMKGRIASMALVHQMLYRGGDLSRVNLAEYVRTLAVELEGSLAPRTGPIRLSVDADEVRVALETAVPCGLILNELVTNATKHAFPDGRGGEIRILLRAGRSDDIRMEVSDDGVGFPRGFDVRQAQSMGLWTVNLLIRQIGGEASFESGEGVTCRIRVPVGPGAGEAAP